jgi:hypothetical protein
MASRGRSNNVDEDQDDQGCRQSGHKVHVQKIDEGLMGIPRRDRERSRERTKTVAEKKKRPADQNRIQGNGRRQVRGMVVKRDGGKGKKD